MSLQQTVDIIMSKLENLLNTRTVIGDPIQVGEVTLIPVIDASFGFGAGAGEGKSDAKDSGSGGGGGGGARLSVAAVLVVKGGEVSAIPIRAGGSIQRLVDAVPDILEKLKRGKQQEEDRDEGDDA